MRHLVLTVIGDDRPGLVASLASVVADHGGNWERSEMTRLAGKFAGIVVVTVAPDQAEALIEATAALPGLIVTAHPGTASDIAAADVATAQPRIVLDLLGNDRPGIVHEISAVLGAHNVSIEALTTSTREAPMAGGLLFQANITALVTPDVDLAEVRADLERVAAELLVELEFAD